MNLAVSMQKIAIGYGASNILKDITAEIGIGEFVGIVGANGAGKSTLLRTLRGFLPAQSGKIYYFGQDITTLGAQKKAKLAAYMQQANTINFNYTGKDVVKAGRYPYLKWYQPATKNDEMIVDACMQYTGVEKLQDVPLQMMSGGQRQRVFLAKILAQTTPILFMDEPTAGLDLFYQEEIFRFTRELARNRKTILMVIHELNLAARYCDRILLLGQGKLIADGVPEQVFTEKMLSMAYATNMRVVRNPLTNNLEISTRPNLTVEKNGENLLKKICSMG